MTASEIELLCRALVGRIGHNNQDIKDECDCSKEERCAHCPCRWLLDVDDLQDQIKALEAKPVGMHEA